MEKLESINKLKKVLKKEIVEEVLDILRDEIEENLADDFISRVEQAELRAEGGAVSQYTSDEFKTKFL